jgi:predicted FMN-binding regulatory protein PaiB
MDIVTGKFKLGQNMSPETAERIMERLEQRDDPQDRRTVSAMQRARE